MFSHRDVRRVQTSSAMEAAGEGDGGIAQVDATVPRICPSAISCHNQLGGANQRAPTHSAPGRIVLGLASTVQNGG